MVSCHNLYNLLYLCLPGSHTVSMPISFFFSLTGSVLPLSFFTFYSKPSLNLFYILHPTSLILQYKFRCSSETNAICTLEQWYLLFSLLNTISASPIGRPFAWQAICYLMNTNNINDMNFTPCRHLVLQFLSG
jgi:hypothetical protein